MIRMLVAASLLAGLATAAHAQTPEPWPEAWFEIFKLAPGKHEAFVRNIALADEVAKAGGQPPIKLYFHENGADWDVLMLKVVGERKPTPEQQAAMEAKRKELGLPSGPAYFVRIRENIAAHTDSKAVGPISAAEWLAKLDGWRAENGKKASK